MTYSEPIIVDYIGFAVEKGYALTLIAWKFGCRTNRKDVDDCSRMAIERLSIPRAKV